LRTTRSHLAFGLSGVCARVRARTTSEGRKRTLRHATVFVDEARHGGLGGLVASSGEGHWNTGGQTEEHAPTAVAESESTRTRDSGPWSLAGEAQTAVMQLIGSRGAALERCVVRTVWVALQVAQRRACLVGWWTNERGAEGSRIEQANDSLVAGGRGKLVQDEEGERERARGQRTEAGAAAGRPGLGREPSISGAQTRVFSVCAIGVQSLPRPLEFPPTNTPQPAHLLGLLPARSLLWL